jgi:hypothetical protein
VVEQAEAHGPGGAGVVARRANGAEGRLSLAGVEGLDGGQPGAGGEAGGVEGRRSDVGVGIDVAAAALAERLHGIDERGRVDPLECLARRGPGGQRHQRLGDARRSGARTHRVEPGRPLRVAPAGVVVGEPGVGDQQKGHTMTIGRHLGTPSPEGGLAVSSVRTVASAPSSGSSSCTGTA